MLVCCHISAFEDLAGLTFSRPGVWVYL